MTSKKLPKFIFPGAVVSVDGKEQAIKDVKHLKSGVTLRMKEGGKIPFDPAVVKEIPASVPDFIKVGAVIKVTHTLWDSIMTDSNRKYDGTSPREREYTVTGFENYPNGNGRPRLRLSVKEAGERPTFMFFDAAKMKPVEQAPPESQLPADIAIRKGPLKFKLK